MAHHYNLITIVLISVLISQVSSTFNLLDLMRMPNNGFPRDDRSPEESTEGSVTSQPKPSSIVHWPSAVRIIDVNDLANMFVPRPTKPDNQTHPTSTSLWSSIFNIFNDDPEMTLEDEMERENVAWFAIPGWNAAMLNGTGLGSSIYPGLLVPAKASESGFNNSPMFPFSGDVFSPFQRLFNLTTFKQPVDGAEEHHVIELSEPELLESHEPFVQPMIAHVPPIY